jgi:ATP-dependent Clp protease ATP-binding subunit ClpX
MEREPVQRLSPFELALVHALAMVLVGARAGRLDLLERRQQARRPGGAGAGLLLGCIFGPWERVQPNATTTAMIAARVATLRKRRRCRRWLRFPDPFVAKIRRGGVSFARRLGATMSADFPPSSQSSRTTPPEERPAAEKPPPVDKASPQGPSCSFCGKHQAEVRKLIAGPTVYICDECIRLCNDILEEELPPAEAPQRQQEAAASIEEVLAGFIVSRHEVQRALAAALYQHRLDVGAPSAGAPAPRLLLVGPTGSGKTTIGHAVCAVSGRVALARDVCWLSEIGYAGEDTTCLFKDLTGEAGGDSALGERGVVFLDGLEKLKAARTSAGAQRDIHGEGVQRELIALLDGARSPVPETRSRGVTSARGVLVVGALRLDAADVPPGATEGALRRAAVAAGVLPELIARFDRVLALPALAAESLAVLLTHPRGPLAEARSTVTALGGTLEYTPEANAILAQAAATSPDGAWMLRRAVQRHLSEVLLAPDPKRAFVVDEAAAWELVSALG